VAQQRTVHNRGLCITEFQRRTAIAYDNARAVNAVMGGGIDDVIDPANRRSYCQQSETAAAGDAKDGEEVSVCRPVVSMRSG
jgi:hypothetical protein